jgi:hypothetical protein
MKNALAVTITTLPGQLLRSLTWDRGKEHTSRRNSTGNAFGMMNILPARTNPHRQGVNRAGGSLQSFLTHVIEPTAAGQPRIVAVSILGAAHLMSGHLAFYNSGAATIQVLIGVGLLFPRTVKPTLLVSFGWALGV